LNTENNCKVTGYGNSKFVSTNFYDKYLIFKINYKAIPDADDTYNIHQLSAFKTELEDELDKQKISYEKEIEKLNLVLSNLGF
jgi:hypothetical protein